MQHGRLGDRCDPHSCQIPKFIPQSALPPCLGREKGLQAHVTAACLLTWAGQSCQSSAALWTWAGSSRVGTLPWEGNGGGGAPQVPWASLLAQPGEQQAAGPCWRETKGGCRNPCPSQWERSLAEGQGSIQPPLGKERLLGCVWRRVCRFQYRRSKNTSDCDFSHSVTSDFT